MKIKTSELTGAALDWAVAKCEGWIKGDITNPKWCRLWREELRTPPLYPSTNWPQGGPIIERERIEITDLRSQQTGVDWGASLITQPRPGAYHNIHKGYGPTPLIAAMRCFCASKLGDEADVPEELCTSN